MGEETPSRIRRLLARLPRAFPIVIALACGRPPDVRSPPPEIVMTPAEGQAAWTQAKGVFESRCIFCHGCYDAPCQLKLGSYEGIERGSSEAVVYDGARLVAADPTRLGIDAHTRLEWRKKGFHPVLPEGRDASSEESVLVRMLDLKRRQPLVNGVDVGKEFTLTLDRKQTCTDADHFDDYAKKHPLWGMPYGLPGLSPDEEAKVVTWVRAGAPHPDSEAAAASVPERTKSAIADWEHFLDDGSLKGQLVARYVYEHLFYASIRFDDEGTPARYRLVRSSTESGKPVVEIPTRTPFEDPKTPRVHYRFVLRDEPALEKTHMPYRLDAARLERFKKLFFEPSYEVKRLPGYDREISSNPFRAFQALPMTSRYRFMLEEAEYTMMGFIKGPVCRGQVALNVIEDRFWIAFVDPSAPWSQAEADFLSTVKLDLDMPAEAGKNALPTLWFRYGAANADYVRKKAELVEQVTKDGRGVTMDTIWNGDGTNTNAALTVFRHFDSATVVKGFVGNGPPKTAWLVDYPLLERIHYLLVAGFDVFGNVGHQLTTRLYMDYLRMGSEANFLSLLPMARRATLANEWYRGVTGEARVKILDELVGKNELVGIHYTSKTPELEAFDMIRKRLGPALATDFALSFVEDADTRWALERLGRVRGRAASLMPETSFLVIADEHGNRTQVAVLRDSAHTNVAHLFNEDARRVPDEDALDVVYGLLGAYPNALFSMKASELGDFAEAVTALDGPAAYEKLRARFGMQRMNQDFWRFSDQLNADHLSRSPVENGLFDYNRLDGF